MKTSISLYLEGLMSIAARTGRLPPSVGSAQALEPLWRDLRRLISADLDTFQASAAAREILAYAPAVRAALLDAEGPIADALDKLRSKTAVPSPLRSAEWSLFPAQIREASQFSAGVASARVLASLQSALEANLRADLSQPKGREAFLRDMRAVLEAEGVGWETSREGHITNPRANSRLGLIYDQQTSSARGYARLKIGLDPDMLSAAPAQELIREAEPKGGPSARRPWPRIWREAGGKLTAGRMAALKTDPVWSAISRFGVPWPPFDFGSHMGVRDILRPEAEALGLLLPSSQVTPPASFPDYAAVQRARVDNIPEPMLAWLRSAYGDRLDISGSTATLRPKA